MSEVDIDLTAEENGTLMTAVQSDTESLLLRLIDTVKNARSLPLSTSVRIERDEVIEVLEEALDALPEELRQARWLLRERDEFLTRVQKEGDDILETARTRAQNMVQRTEIMREAQRQAQKTIDEANESAQHIRMEAEDYCDQKLAAFEIILERTQTTVKAGREKLHVTPLPQGGTVEADTTFFEGETEEAFYDQDDE